MIGDAFGLSLCKAGAIYNVLLVCRCCGKIEKELASFTCLEDAVLFSEAKVEGNEIERSPEIIKDLQESKSPKLKEFLWKRRNIRRKS